MKFLFNYFYLVFHLRQKDFAEGLLNLDLYFRCFESFSL